MFENSAVMVIRADKNEDYVYRLEMDATTQQELCISFSNAHDELLNGE